MKPFYIVWNTDKTEGVIFDDKKDAQYTMNGEVRFGATGAPVIGEDFREAYAAAGPLHLQKVQL